MFFNFSRYAGLLLALTVSSTPLTVQSMPLTGDESFSFIRLGSSEDCTLVAMYSPPNSNGAAGEVAVFLDVTASHHTSKRPYYYAGGSRYTGALSSDGVLNWSSEASGLPLNPEAFALGNCGLTNVRFFAPRGADVGRLEDQGEMFLRFRADEGNTTYDYDVTISSDGSTRASKEEAVDEASKEAAEAECNMNSALNSALDLLDTVHLNHWTSVNLNGPAVAESIPRFGRPVDRSEYKTVSGLYRTDVFACASLYCMHSISVVTPTMNTEVQFVRWGGTALPDLNARSIIFENHTENERCQAHYVGDGEFKDAWIIHL